MDLYNILWVDKNSSKEEIKKSYRKLAMEYHPDRNNWSTEAEKKFKEINMAYEILSNDEKRRNYDMYWTTSSSWNPFWWAGVDVDLWDIFESFFWWWFSAWKTRKREYRGEDLEYNLNIDLKTSIIWWKETIKFNKKEQCKNCNWDWGFWKKTCQKCNWRWQVTHATQSIFWMIQQTITCDECWWTWEIFEKVCEDCNWKKRILVKKELEIKIPAWIDDGMVIKMTWEWNDWVWTNAKWDLFIKFSIENDEKWLVRDWVDLHYNLEIDVIQAILWTTKEINIPIIGKRKIEIKPWTDVNSVIKISWDWVKYIDRDKKWDLFIKIDIKIPKKLGKKERELYEEIANEKKLDVNKWWVFNKIFW